MDYALVMGDYFGDVVVVDEDLEADKGLETAVIVSLFTDRRAALDQLPVEFPADDLRGWWGDVAPQVEGDQTGSLLWLLAREKQLPATLARARQYAEDALRWMLEDKVAQQVVVAASWLATGWMLLQIDIYRPGGDVVRYRYGYEWASQAARRIV
ncbi:phage GP46 family protein [Pseudomonas schmalbachii]|uniref:Phage GP46 family protein n=1 Tax=Pseudomonas schmalbachii TaxID=2816993 RepID=A0ABS3TKD2_9PSED|nr:phage GP46 family protein [Pseudomonas schmalbachii]MBO3274121.1 phage GP46 family protein [Pseudomonas schmalbachii]